MSGRLYERNKGFVGKYLHYIQSDLSYIHIRLRQLNNNVPLTSAELHTLCSKPNSYGHWPEVNSEDDMLEYINFSTEGPTYVRELLEMSPATNLNFEEEHPPTRETYWEDLKRLVRVPNSELDRHIGSLFVAMRKWYLRQEIQFEGSHESDATELVTDSVDCGGGKSTDWRTKVLRMSV